MSGFVNKETAREASELVYPNKETGQPGLPPGFQLDPSFAKNGELERSNGVFVYALMPKPDNHDVPANTRILAMRGTEPTKATDLYADAYDIGRGQFNAAKTDINQWMARNIKDGNNIEVTGHSLGGALVQWTVNDKNLDDITKVPLTSSKPGQPGQTHLSQADVQSHLHFTTFNAPGICQVPDTTAKEHTTAVQGEHHVIAFEKIPGSPLYSGDPVHVLGGAHVGGVLIAHRPDYAAQKPEDKFFVHSIKNANHNWDAPVVPGYQPPKLNTGEYQAFVENGMHALGQDKQPTSDLDAAKKLGLALALAGAKAEQDTVIAGANAVKKGGEAVGKVIGDGMTAYGEAQIREAEANRAMAQSVIHTVKDGAHAAVNAGNQALHATEQAVQKGSQVVGKAVGDGMTAYGQAQIRQSEADMAMAQSLSNTVKSGAHAVADAGSQALHATERAAQSTVDTGKKLIKDGVDALETGKNYLSKSLADIGLLSMPESPSSRMLKRSDPQPTANQGAKP